MQAAEPRKFRALQPRNGAQHARLLAVFQLGLEADHIIERAERIILAQLHHRKGLHARLMGIGQPDRFHRTPAQRFPAALGHHFDRQAAVEIGRVLEVLELGLLGGEQRVDEILVLIAIQGAVDVIGAAAAGSGLVVARLQPGLAHVDRIAMHDRRDSVEKG